MQMSATSVSSQLGNLRFVRLEMALMASLLALVVLLPLPLGSNRPWAWSVMQGFIALQTLLLMVSYRQLPWARVRHAKPLLLILISFQLWVAMQLIPMPIELLKWLSPIAAEIYAQIGISIAPISLDPLATQSALLRGVSLVLLVINASLLLHNVERLKLCVLAIIVSGTLQSVYGAALVLSKLELSPLFSMPVPNVATGSFVYQNHLASYLSMALCMGIGLIITQLHTSASGSWHIRLRRWLSGMLSSKMMLRLCLILMVITLLLTRSRMGNSAFFAATVFGGLLALLLYKSRPRALTAFMVSILVIDTLLLGSLFGIDDVKQRLVETSLESESRDQVVLWGLHMIQDFALTGSGLGSFYGVFPIYAQANVGFYDHAHNEYVQFAAEAGIAGLLMVGFAVLYSAWCALIALRTRNSRSMKGLALGCLMAIFALSLHISVDFILQAYANAATFTLILFIACCTKRMAITRPALQPNEALPCSAQS